MQTAAISLARPPSMSVEEFISPLNCVPSQALPVSGKLCFINVGILGTMEVIFHDPNALLLAMMTIIFSPVISVV